MHHTERATARGRARRPLVLFVGHASSPTGFARVIRSLMTHLPSDYDLHHYGTNDTASDAGARWTRHGNPDPAGVLSLDALEAVVGRVRPRVVVVVDEPWVCARLGPAILGKPGLRTVFYGAIDSERAVPPMCLPALARLDRFVAFTRFGLGVFERAFRAHGPYPPPPTEVIPHGVDTGLFFPVAPPGDGGDFSASRTLARRELFGMWADPGGTFIVLNANRNQPNKRIDLCLEGFARFAEGKPPGVKLYLHMASRKCAPGFTPLVDRFGIRDRVLATTIDERHPSVSDRRLNLIYNACDVGVNTSEGEGWGLISCEHAATGAAQVVPRHSACAEIWGGAAHFLEPAGFDETQRYQRAGRTVTVEGIAEALEALYERPNLRLHLAQAAYQLATRPENGWRAIAGRWDGLLQSLLAGD